MELDQELILWRIALDDYVAGLQWSYDHQLIYAGSASGHFSVISVADGIVLYQVNAHAAGLNALAASPLSHRVITAGKDGKVNLYDGLTATLLQQLEGGSDWVEHLAWAPNGQHFATAAGKTVRIWTEAGALVSSYDQHASTVSALYWRSDSQALATACYGKIAFFNLSQIPPFEILHWKTPIISLTWSPNGRYMLAGTQDARIQVWKLPHVPESEMAMNGYLSKVKEFAWHFQGALVATNCGPEIVIWDTSGNGPEGRTPAVLSGHLAKISKLAFQHEGELLASADDLGLVLIRHPRNKNLHIQGFAESPVCQLSWSADDSHLLVGTTQGEVMVWEAPF